ncbi:MAG TPA: hypothetical protein PKL14_04155 [Holophaga sp.]|nr:hypothetical protein [Holophaga sp.]
MEHKIVDREGKQVIIRAAGNTCASKHEILGSPVFRRILFLFVEHLQANGSLLVNQVLPGAATEEEDLDEIILLFRILSDFPIEEAVNIVPAARKFVDADGRKALWEFVEALYDYWRSFDRYMVIQSEDRMGGPDKRPYRAFNATIEELTHLIRSTYRDMCENILGDHPRIYRQVPAGCNVGLIAVPKASPLPEPFREQLKDLPFIRQVWIDPPLILDPPSNKRTGSFTPVSENPLAGFKPNPTEWICYPAQVGPMVMFVYFHKMFMGMGCALANLFDLATDEQIAKGPAAIFMYGVPEELSSTYKVPTVIHETAEGLLVGAVPGKPEFSYFGYLKKMLLTLHNVAMVKRGRMPYHGAMMRIMMKSGRNANILIIGDTATGKSESLEAFRKLGEGRIREIRIVADDMGSLEVDAEGRILGYGTETGAFVRLDDLGADYTFKQMDRAIFFSPQKRNARVVIPITTLDEVLHGYPLDFILYGNNYEEVNEGSPVLQRFDNAEEAISTFRAGNAMSKGTTTQEGLTHSYFANPFGAPHFKELHEIAARPIFQTAFDKGLFVGQLRTRLAIPGMETTGPEAAAKALLDMLEA